MGEHIFLKKEIVPFDLLVLLGISPFQLGFPTHCYIVAHI